MHGARREVKGQGSGLTSPGPARTSLGYLGRRTPLVVWVERRLPYFAGWDVQPRLKLARSKNTSSVASLETCRLMQRGRGGILDQRIRGGVRPNPFCFCGTQLDSMLDRSAHATVNGQRALYTFHLYICYDQVPMQRTTNEHAVTVAGVGPRGQGYQGSPSHAPAYTPQPGLPGAPCVRLWVGWWCVGGEGDRARGGACAVRGARRVVWVGGARA